ncbi:hypothetical protein IU486_20820 [Streptomyces gardneri]|nr:hypothetical protein [Streptomyces gardneri]
MPLAPHTQPPRVDVGALGGPAIQHRVGQRLQDRAHLGTFASQQREDGTEASAGALPDDRDAFGVDVGLGGQRSAA